MFFNALKNSMLAKVAGLLALTVLLCIPLARINALNEAQNPQEATEELARTPMWPAKR